MLLGKVVVYNSIRASVCNFEYTIFSEYLVMPILDLRFLSYHQPKLHFSMCSPLTMRNIISALLIFTDFTSAFEVTPCSLHSIFFPLHLASNTSLPEGSSSFWKPIFPHKLSSFPSLFSSVVLQREHRPQYIFTL